MRPLQGQPLLVHTIEAAVASGIFGAVVVSTDCPSIAQIAKAVGAEVPFHRPASLAGDHVPSAAVSLHALQMVDPIGQDYIAIAQLLPSCPLRTADHIRASFEAFKEDIDSPMISVTRMVGVNPWWAMKLDSRRLNPLFPDRLEQRSQDLPRLIFPSGAIWWTSTTEFRQTKSFHGPSTRGWEIPWPGGFDIDDSVDWEVANALMRDNR